MTAPNRSFDKFFNQDSNPLSGNYTMLSFDRTMDGHQIVNDDSSLDLEVSYTGGPVHFVVKPGEDHSYDERRRNKIYLREAGGTDSGISYRVSSWSTN